MTLAAHAKAGSFGRLATLGLFRARRRYFRRFCTRRCATTSRDAAFRSCGFGSYCGSVGHDGFRFLHDGLFSPNTFAHIFKLLLNTRLFTVHV